MVKLTHLFTALMGTVAIASPAMFNRKDIQAHLCDTASDSDTGLTLGGPPEAPELTTIIIGYDHLSCDSPEGKFNLQAGKCYDWDFPSLRLMYRRCGQGEFHGH
jgi:hypothetical protein